MSVGIGVTYSMSDFDSILLSITHVKEENEKE